MITLDDNYNFITTESDVQSGPLPSTVKGKDTYLLFHARLLQNRRQYQIVQLYDADASLQFSYMPPQFSVKRIAFCNTSVKLNVVHM